MLVWGVHVPREPFSSQVLPGGISAFDQPNFLGSAPAFELLFAVDCFVYVVEGFVVDQAVATILLAEALSQVVFVFVGAAAQIVGHADVDDARLAGDDVDAVAMRFHGRRGKQVPPLRIAIDKANRNAPVGMTGFS